ncbi:hypothetical protein NC652_011116 [Populus alba x Populus x berolinensis]|nr:hypothetical protein NC652_011116 [Populus alba x Populus x berolinensis]
MFHNFYLSTQPPPPSSLSTFIAHVSQSLSLSTAPPPIFISHPSTFLTTPHHNLSTFLTTPPQHLHLSQPFFKALSTIFLSFSLSIVD